MIESLTDSSSSLYLIATKGELEFSHYLDVVSKLVEGGVDLVQMREKSMAPEETLMLGKALRSLCTELGVFFVVNDDAHLAHELNADGLHLGQDDMKPQHARAIVGSKMAIGLSTHSHAQLKEAWGNPNVDMMGFGPMFSTQTKDAGPPLGLAALKDAESQDAPKPMWCIGGIKATNLPSLVQAGCQRVAVSHALLAAKDPKAEAKLMKDLLASG